MSEENGTMPEQPIMNMQLTPQGIMLSFPVNLGMDNETVKQLIKAYLAQHPELVQEIAKEAVKQKQQELQIIQMVKQSRND